MISRVRDSVIPATELSHSNLSFVYTVPETRRVRSAVAKFGVDFYKDAYSEWVEEHMQCAACGGSYCERNARHE